MPDETINLINDSYDAIPETFIKENSDPARRMKHLTDFLNKCDYEYYTLNAPQISDTQYDALFAELAQLEKKYPRLKLPDSPVARVSGTVSKEFKTVAHTTPMLSLANSYSSGDLIDFENRILRELNSSRSDGEILKSEDIEYCVELKFDGASISLKYERGILKSAATRGDGRIGEDVTANVMTIKNVPLKLNIECDVLVRGEIFMPRDVFAALNAAREESGEPVFANPRNAAAGSLRQLDSSITSSRGLDIFIYNLAEPPVIYNNDKTQTRISFATHSETLDFLKKAGLKISSDYVIVHGIKEAACHIQKWENLRHKLNYDTDGMVVKLNSIAYQRLLDFTARSPRFAMAYKYAPERAETVIESIVLQVGKMGTLTPVANLKPVMLSGTRISRASLHNADEIKSRDIRAGDYVIVEKAGEIIPQIVEVVKTKRPEGLTEFEMPSKCPACGFTVSRNEGETAFRCVSLYCPAQIIRKAEYFVSKYALDFDGFGEKIIESLIEHKLINDMADILTLKYEDFLQLPRFKEKLAAKLANEIETKKNTTLNRFISALQIPFVGETTAAALANHFKTFDRMTAAKYEDFLAINEIGEKIALSLYHFLNDENNKKIIDKMFNAGLKIETSFAVERVSERLKGMVFVITGILPVTRREVEELIEIHGGAVSSSVSKKTTYVVAGETPGSKYDKALKLGVSIATYNDLLKMTVNG